MDTAVKSFVMDHALLRKGHFLLSSGMHSPHYLELEAFVQDPALTATVCRPLAERFRGQHPQVVLAAAGIDAIFGYELARQLGARTIVAGGDPGKRSLRPGFRLDPGERVLIVMGVIVTGESAREVMHLAAARDATVVGVAVLVDRSGIQLRLEAPVEALAVVDLDAYHAPICPLCADNVPLERRLD